MMSLGSFKDIVEAVRAGKIGVTPTDTIYGVVCSALNKDAVENLYKIRERNEHKPCIVLIADSSELAQFGILPDTALSKELSRVWPGSVSVVIDCFNNEFTYLHRGTNSLAFRVPDDSALRDFLKQTGPLIAPSANPEGEPPAKTIEEARTYFGDTVDFYLDGGERVGEPSTLVKYDSGKLVVLRQGAVRV